MYGLNEWIMREQIGKNYTRSLYFALFSAHPFLLQVVNVPQCKTWSSLNRGKIAKHFAKQIQNSAPFFLSSHVSAGLTSLL